MLAVYADYADLVSSPMTCFQVNSLDLFFFSSRFSFFTNLNSFFAKRVTSSVAAKILFSGVRYSLMTGSRGGISAASSVRAR